MMFNNLTAAEATRLGIYILGALLGAFMVGLGALRGDWQLIAAGTPLIGISGTAGVNISRTAETGEHAATDDELDDEPIG